MTLFYKTIFLRVNILIKICFCTAHNILNLPIGISVREKNGLLRRRGSDDTFLFVSSSNSTETNVLESLKGKQEKVEENGKFYENGAAVAGETALLKPESIKSSHLHFIQSDLTEAINATLPKDRHKIVKLLQGLLPEIQELIHQFIKSKTRTFRTLRNKQKNNIQKKLSTSRLFIVAALLARHKYTGYDPRQNADFRVKYFYRSFPLPRLDGLHPIVRKACDNGFNSCVREISEYTETDSSEPLSLDSEQERFEFLATASYYMCWFTMKRIERLLLLDNAKKDKFQCLDFSVLRQHGDKYTKNQMRMSRPSGPSIKDIRLSQFKRPFLCADLSFCPDYCYGRKTHGTVKDIRRDPGNPCLSLQDSWCSVNPKKNTDFLHLIKNDFNYSCRCEIMQAGFTWNKRLGLCVDIDECEEGLDNCAENMICKNTVGSFQCFCNWGYYWNGFSCIEMIELQNRVVLKHPKRETVFSSDGHNLIIQISAANFIHPIKHIIIIITSYCIQLWNEVKSI